MARDIHKKPFDEGTKAKLSIFQDYLKEWLPVFFAKNKIIWTTIKIHSAKKILYRAYIQF